MIEWNVLESKKADERKVVLVITTVRGHGIVRNAKSTTFCLEEARRLGNALLNAVHSLEQS